MVQVIGGYSKSLYTILGAIGFVALIDTSMISPIIASQARALNADAFLAGLIAGAYSLVAIPMIVLGGYLTDTFGRRRAMTVGLAGDLIAMTLYALSPSPQILLAARVLHAVFDSFIVPSALALIGDFFSKDVGRPLSLFWTFVTAAIIAGSGSASGLVSTLGFQTVYIVIGALVAVSLAATLAGLPTPPHSKPDRRGGTRIIRTYALRVSLSMLSILSMYLLIGGIVGTLPTMLIDRFGFDERLAAAQVGLFMALSTAVSIPIFPLSARLTKTRTPLLPLVMGQFASMATALVLEHGVGSLQLRLLASIIFGFALGAVIFSSSYLVVTLPQEARGLGSGLNQSASLLGVAIGAPLTSLYISTIGWTNVFTIFGALPPLATSLLIFIIRRRAAKWIKE
ncbi:MAG: MFS transporter [Nitrososphaerota archaeon]